MISAKHFRFLSATPLLNYFPNTATFRRLKHINEFVFRITSVTVIFWVSYQFSIYNELSSRINNIIYNRRAVKSNCLQTCQFSAEIPFYLDTIHNNLLTMLTVIKFESSNIRLTLSRFTLCRTGTRENPGNRFHQTLN